MSMSGLTPCASFSRGMMPVGQTSAQRIQENFLQRKVFDDKTEIFGLIAPPTHEDSMDIHEEALFIMLDNIVRSYVAEYFYSALVDSYCCEQSARMNAMDEADRNAAQLMNSLRLEYNHARQSRITQEITEISAGAKALRKKKRRSETVNGR